VQAMNAKTVADIGRSPTVSTVTSVTEEPTVEASDYVQRIDHLHSEDLAGR
jgi:hypothetical protein